MSVTVANSSHVNPSMTEVDLLRIIATNITTIAANPSGPVYQTSTGGNGSADTGKLLMFGADGEASCSRDWHVEPNDAGTVGGTIFLRDKGGSWTARIRPTTLTNNRQFTIPDAGGTWALLEVANVFTAGQTIQPASAATCLTLAGGTVTTSNPLIAATQTWNDAGVAFSAFTIAITDTAKAANSSLFKITRSGATAAVLDVFVTSPYTYLRFGGTDANAAYCQFSSQYGNLFITPNSGGRTYINSDNTDIRVTSSNAATTYFTLSSDGAANILALRNGANAQTFRSYYSYTDGSNYQRAALKVAAANIELAAETAGTGADNIDLLLTPAGTGVVQFGTHSALGAETLSGFITINDSGGTPRKLAVVS